MRIVLSAVVAIAGAASSPATAATPCAPRATVADLARIQTDWLHALAGGDRTGFDRLTAPGFTAIERGRAMSADQLFAMIGGAVRDGKAFTWSVTEPRAEIDCSLAVLSYVNDGAISSGGGAPEHLRWLETAVMRWTPAGWRVRMGSSQRVPTDGAVDRPASAAGSPPAASP